MKLLGWLLWSLCTASAAHAASVSGTVSSGRSPAANVIVYLERTDGAPLPEAPEAHAVMDQKNLAFVPPVLPIVRGTTVDFTNSDDIQHNVFSPSTVANKFDIGTSGPSSTHSVVFNQLGEAVILCNIHMEMEARIVVLEQPYFDVTDRQGRYHIDALPPGSYVAKVWKGRFLPDGRKLDLSADDAATLDLQLAE